MKGNLTVTTSWDDGTVTDIRLAELLYKYKVKGTFYISRCREQKLLSESNIIEISKEFEIGCHTISHHDLTKLLPPVMVGEIGDSKKYLENLLSHRVRMFCYPEGRYNKTVKRLVEAGGFLGSRTCRPMGFDLTKRFCQLDITMPASNDSPLMDLKTCAKLSLWLSFDYWFNWETRAKILFDLALRKGGIYHIYGHSAELDDNNGWNMLEGVLVRISNQDEVKYMTNGEIFEEQKRCQEFKRK